MQPTVDIDRRLPPLGGWRLIPGFSQYAANPKGEILNLSTRYATKGGNAGRYLKVAVRRDGDTALTLQHVHDLVCRAFHGLPEPGQVVLHKNDRRWDNRSVNLEWGSQSQNIKDTYARGLRQPTYGPRRVVNPVSLEVFALTDDDIDALAHPARKVAIHRLPTVSQEAHDKDDTSPIVVVQEGTSPFTVVSGEALLHQVQSLENGQAYVRHLPMEHLRPYLLSQDNPHAHYLEEILTW